MRHALLIDTQTSRIVEIEKDSFRIGRDKNYVDYAVDNPAISRTHCMIVRKDDGYRLVDCHSKNHTYLDGELVPPTVEQPLHHEAVISLGNMHFVFLLREEETNA